ncbi:MAG: SLC13 family permease [Gammaproteobacteria bacterium]|nr:SLC13 family permease [Gammaproteobacteria bacterium]MDH3449981.1 SLC13 family permease [Gammaproteobacteria bacterium]
MEFLANVPGFHAYVVMCLVVLALIMFASERLPLATSSLLILVLLTLLFEVFPFTGRAGRLYPSDLFLGFGHQALVAVCALMIAGQALVRTGALEPIGRQLARWWALRPLLTFLAALVIGAMLSAFINNTPVVILMLPILISVSLKTATPASDLLMPMGLATSIGGMATSIGTSTNLLVVAVAADLGLRELGMFDFVFPAIVAGGVGIVYLWLVAPKLLPPREARLPGTSPRLFTAQLRIHDDSVANQKKLSEVIDLAGGNLEVVHIIRGKKNNRLVAIPDMVLRSGDRIIVKSTPDRLKELETVLGASLFSGDERVDDEHPLQDATQQIAEVVVVPGSTLDGRTLANIRFRERYQLMVLALFRSNKWASKQGTEHTEETRLHSGDVLLVQGSVSNINRLKSSRNLLVLDAKSALPISSRAPIAMLIMLWIILTAAFGLLPIAISALTGVLLLLVTGCLKWYDTTRALSAPVILLIVTSLAMGTAMVQTGGADMIASAYVSLSAGASPALILSGLLAMMALLTNVVSNNAAAVIGTPIAIGIAHQLGQPAEPFVLAVIFGANMSFATPMAYQTNLLVMNAGNYSFGDFVRVGLPLVLLMWAVLSFLLPWLYGI